MVRELLPVKNYGPCLLVTFAGLGRVGFFLDDFVESDGACSGLTTTIDKLDTYRKQMNSLN